MCTCTIVNGTLKYKKSIVSPVPPNNNCDAVIVAPAGDSKKASEELCPRCECIYESRNTGIIKVVVAIVIWIISVLVIYMFFLLCLDPLLNKRAKSSYVEHTNEEPQVAVDRTQWVLGAPERAEWGATSSIGWAFNRTSGNVRSKNNARIYTTDTQCSTEALCRQLEERIVQVA
ncbi:hypothetical protein AAG570_004332 [Ranatra chinensis]|uniref:Uncharacterized protein n=1 Tax=Ranatra chinensis TaxID=642074 RepID=A0ABD0YIS5_9HEMI